MQAFSRAIGVLLLLAGPTFGCAARLPLDPTFRPGDCTPVTRIAPGARVEVRYVFGEPQTGAPRRGHARPVVVYSRSGSL